MRQWFKRLKATGAAGFLSRLTHDRSGNTLMIVAISLVPLLAMIGGGIDMSRSYMTQTRLQQACDSGVLAARKRMGSTVVNNGVVPSAVSDFGNTFFDTNFRAGAYGSQSRDFQMTVESDYSISGVASATVPTTLMRLFGFSSIPITVNCTAKMNYANTDVMMVLDTTGSMNDTNPGDTLPKIQVLRNTVKSFYAQLEAAKTPGTRIRYGFVPYSTNVNVGGLLKSKWLVDTWSYSGRVAKDTGTMITVTDWQTGSNYISGGTSSGTTYTDTVCPSNGATETLLNHWFDANGTENWTYRVNGTNYNCAWATESSTVTITPYTYNNYTYTYWQKQTGTHQAKKWIWHHDQMSMDVSSYKNSNPNLPPVGGAISVNMGGYPDSPSSFNAPFNGCVEERSTYEITDFNNVDFSQAKDLDIDTEPTPGQPATQWRPMLPDISWLRMLTGWNWNTYPWSSAPGDNDPGAQGEVVNANWWGLSACPAPASKLAEMTSTDIATYVDSLVARGSTYHDIGMIWGGRLLSPTGIFAAENADLPGQPTGRHLIFLTDGLTQPNVMTYGAYGIEPNDRRRWSTSSAATLTETVENRFTVACNEVKKRNITVWVIGFGQTLNPVLSNCAGAGHAFYASDAASLNDTFSRIAAAMGDLRISR